MRIIRKGDSFSLEDLAEGGAFLIDKDLDWTSFDVVNKIRYSIKRALQKKKVKVGHAGTLDPRATGLLLVCFSKATKQISSLQILDKEYTGTIELGATTPTYDTESEIDKTYPIDQLDKKKIDLATQKFIGEIEQYPPIFSAIKKDGVPMYKRARAGVDVKMNSRIITINNFVVTKVDIPFVDFQVNCSKGTYIRSLAYDFGRALDSGGYLKGLRRTKIGEFDVKNSFSVHEVTNIISSLST